MFYSNRKEAQTKLEYWYSMSDKSRHSQAKPGDYTEDARELYHDNNASACPNSCTHLNAH